MGAVKSCLETHEGLYVNHRGRSERLALSWMKSLNVRFLSLSFNHNDQIGEWEANVPWRFDGIHRW